MVFAKVPGGGNGGEAFRGGDGVGARDRWVGSIEIGRLNFDIAGALFVGEPILASEECSVGIRKRTSRGNYGEAYELCVDPPGLG